MCAIVLSINQPHVENIFSGIKRYEFRKSVCKRDVDKIIIYCTDPVKKIVGEADVKEVLIDTPSEIWDATKEASGIDKMYFDKYFENRKRAVAYELENVRKFDPYKQLEDYGIKSAPQSFQYVK